MTTYLLIPHPLSINYESVTRRLRGLSRLLVKIQNPESWAWSYHCGHNSESKVLSLVAPLDLGVGQGDILPLTAWFMILDSGFCSCIGLLEQNHEPCWRRPLDQSRFQHHGWEFSKHFRQVETSHAQRRPYAKSWCKTPLCYASLQNSKQAFRAAYAWIVTKNEAESKATRMWELGVQNQLKTLPLEQNLQRQNHVWFWDWQWLN